MHAVGWRFGDKCERLARPLKTRERPALPGPTPGHGGPWMTKQQDTAPQQQYRLGQDKEGGGRVQPPQTPHLHLPKSG